MKKQELKKKKLGEVLVEAGIISNGQLEEALALQRKTRRRLGRIFTELGYVDENELCQTISKQLKISMADLASVQPQEEAVAKVHEELARERVILPIRIIDGELTLAMANPLDWMTIQEVEFGGGIRVVVTIAPESEIVKAIDRTYGLDRSAEDVSAGLPEAAEVDITRIAVEGFGTDIDSLYRAAEFPPVVQIFSKFLVDALRAGATDIHLEPREKYVQARMRVDGNLRNTIRYPRRAHEAIAARAKTLARLDLANRTMPQEGANRVAVSGKEINIRVSTLPSINGESILVNIIEGSRHLINIGKLGFPAEVRMQVSSIVHQGQGLLLLAGLRGSGRHTTLYSLLQFMESDTLSIITIGTSCGYKVDGVKEVNPNEAAGLTLPIALRSVLRHDPDVIAIGNIKDRESAEAAINASMKGKLVLAIIEAPDAASALDGLLSYGVSPYMIRSTVSGVLAQKLLKRICPDCRDELDIARLTALRNLPEIKKAYTGIGCQHCGNTGSVGRVAVFEFIGMDHHLTKALSNDTSKEAIRLAADTAGFNVMFDDAWAKAATGDISVEEALTIKPHNR